MVSLLLGSFCLPELLINGHSVDLIAENGIAVVDGIAMNYSMAQLLLQQKGRGSRDRKKKSSGYVSKIIHGREA